MKQNRECSVRGCRKSADYEAIFYDVYLHLYGDVRVFYQAHESCPFICQEHLNENERNAKTSLANPRWRAYRGSVQYPHSHSSGQGFVIYRPYSG